MHFVVAQLQRSAIGHQPATCNAAHLGNTFHQAVALLRELTNTGIHKAAVSSAQHSMRLREARYASGNIRECIVKSQAIAAEVAQ